MRAFLIGSAVAALGFATAAAAAQTAPPPPPGVAPGTAPMPMAPPPPPMARHQMRVEFRSDHVMTRDEVAKHVAEMFAKLDTNHDGFITKEEIEGFHAQMEAKMQAAMAKVGDAQMKVENVEKHMADRNVFFGDRGAMFDRLDTNHDGVISREEFMAHKPEVHEERVMIMRGPDGAPGAPGMPPMDGRKMEFRMHGMGMGMGGFGMHLFEMADTNHDGRVSLAEAQAAALAHFDKADLNHDGKITPEERAQAHAEMHEHHPS